MPIKKELIELGKKHPELQEELRTILDGLKIEPPTSKDPVVPATIFKDPEPEKPLASKGNFFTLSPASIQAFNTVILPQIQAKLDETSFEDLAQMMDEMEGLGRSKNIDLETALITFKPIAMNTKKFYNEIREVFRNWLRPKMKLMQTPETTAGERVNMFFLPQ